MHQVVLNANVIVEALRSKRGASNRLLSLLPDGRWQPNLSVPVRLEYEEVLKRQASGFSAEEIERFLDSFALLANHHENFFLWRPALPGGTYMNQALINWWRGYSDEDMENVTERLSYSGSEGIYVTGPEKLALRRLRVLLKAESSRDVEDLQQTD